MNPPISRRAALGALAAFAALPWTARAQDTAPLVEVYKSPSCGCCKFWIRHLEANGFRVKTIEVADTRKARARLGMPEKYGSCHTAVVGGYLAEGHVPARDIQRLLEEKPAALGLAVPDMPLGAPGMDLPEYKGQKDNYNVLLVQKDGSARVWARYSSQERQ